MPLFDIFKISPNGEKIREDKLFSNSAQELVSLYKACGDKIEIIRGYENVDGTETNLIKKPNDNIVQSENKLTTDNKICDQPKYFKRGENEYKLEDGNLYINEWVDANEIELSNIRIINNKNKIIQLQNRKIQVKRWILVNEN